MKKFSKEINKITENKIKKTEEEKIQEKIQDKISSIIENKLSIQINEEPSTNVDYSIKGKDELIKKISEIYNSNTKLVKEKYTSFYYKKFKRTINRVDIDSLIENLKS